MNYNGFEYLSDFIFASDEELLAMPRIGKTILKEIADFRREWMDELVVVSTLCFYLSVLNSSNFILKECLMIDYGILRFESKEDFICIQVHSLTEDLFKFGLIGEDIPLLESLRDMNNLTGQSSAFKDSIEVIKEGIPFVSEVFIYNVIKDLLDLIDPVVKSGVGKDTINNAKEIMVICVSNEEQSQKAYKELLGE